MRTLSSIVATFIFAAPPAMAESKWLESGRLSPSEVSSLCRVTSDVRVLASKQMTSAGDQRWRQLARQKLVVEAFVMGQPPLDSARCYVVARAGLVEQIERRVFEVHDFAVNAENTTVFVVGRNFVLPQRRAESTP